MAGMEVLRATLHALWLRLRGKLKTYVPSLNLDLIKNIFRLLRWRFQRATKKRDLSSAYARTNKEADGAKLPEKPASMGKVNVTWIGHATTIIDMDGKRILTDPVWATAMGPDKRGNAPGISLKDVADVDFVVISHDHLDHFEPDVLGRILKQNPNVKFIVPAGFKDRLITFNVPVADDHVTELSWQQGASSDNTPVGECTIDGIEFRFRETQHWAGIGIGDANTSLWGGYLLHSTEGDKTVFFSGDGGYLRADGSSVEHYKNIKSELDKEGRQLDCAVMSIGCYDPEWFMSQQHMTPEYAIRAAVDDMGCKTFVPIHFEAYRLADDTPAEALSRLTIEWEKRELQSDKLAVLRLGETMEAGVEPNQQRRPFDTACEYVTLSWEIGLQKKIMETIGIGSDNAMGLVKYLKISCGRLVNVIRNYEQFKNIDITECLGIIQDLSEVICNKFLRIFGGLNTLYRNDKSKVIEDFSNALTKALEILGPTNSSVITRDAHGRILVMGMNCQLEPIANELSRYFEKFFLEQYAKSQCEKEKTVKSPTSRRTVSIAAPKLETPDAIGNVLTKSKQ